MLKVILLPYRGEVNPFMNLLADALRASGVDVRFEFLRRPFALWGGVLKQVWPDAIHLQWHHAFFAARLLPVAVLRTIEFYLQWLTLRLPGVRFVWTVHNIVNHEKQQAAGELLACRLLARVVDRVAVHCAAVVPVVAASYRVSATRLTVVPHGQHGDWYPMPAPKHDARRALDICG